MPDFAARIGNVRMKDVAPSNVIPMFRDGLINALSGMGTTTDPRSYSRYHMRFMSFFEIDQAYRGSWVMRKAIDKPATEMVREWRDWQAESDDIALLEKEEKRLQLRQKVRRAEILRGLGGAGLVLYVEGDQTQPLDPATISEGGLTQIHVWHRSRFNLGPMITDWGDPWFGHPSFYEVSLQGDAGAVPQRFHPSRVVAFKAEPISDIVGVSWMDSFWGQSKVQSIIDAVTNVDTADNGFAALIKDARNRRIYIPGLLELVSTQRGEMQLAKRLQAFALGESSNSVSWLDGGDPTKEGAGAEKIEDRQMAWTGMPDLMNAFRASTAAAADMPVTVLWGTSPGGLNATGASDLALWSKTVQGKQDLDLGPCMTQIDAALIPSALGRVDEDIWYEWAPLEAQTEQEEATTFWNFMQGLQILAGLNLIPDIAMEKSVQNLLEERGWLPGMSDALKDIPESERFPSLSAPDPNEQDPNALTDPAAIIAAHLAKGGDPISAVPAGGNAGRRRAANDALKAVGMDDTGVKLVLDAVFGATE